MDVQVSFKISGVTGVHQLCVAQMIHPGTAFEKLAPASIFEVASQVISRGLLDVNTACRVFAAQHKLGDVAALQVSGAF